MEFVILLRFCPYIIFCIYDVDFFVSHFPYQHWSESNMIT